VHIDWASLAVVGVVAAAAALAVVLLVAFGVVALSARTDPGDGARPAVGTAVAVLCLAAAGLIVGYGLYLIIG
jgi:hypothetical protein